MRGLVFEGPGQIEVREIPDARVEDPHDVVIEVEATGICGTDLRVVAVPPLLKAHPGAILGHEIVGRVVEAGPRAGIAPGVRVVLEPNVVCGACPRCLEGRSNLCRSLLHLGMTLPGGFANRVALPGACCVPIPEDLPITRAVLAESLACVVNGLRKVDLHPGGSVVIFGAGPIGLLFLATVRAAGVKNVVVTEVTAPRIAIAKARGATTLIDANDGSVSSRIHEILPDGADVVIDTVGWLLADAIETVRKGGTILVFGVADDVEVAVQPTLLVKKEINVRGTYLTHGGFELALAMLGSDAYDFDGLVTDVFPLDQIQTGFDLAAQRGASLKVAVAPNA
jgi:threonine dehydrogenase-like Zn-dependent dehydrogenase